MTGVSGSIGWVEVGKRVGSLATATAAALVAGFLLVAPFVVGLGGSPLFLLVTPLLLLLFAATVVAAVWLARRSRIPWPWLRWFLLGAGAIGPSLLVVFALSYHGGR